MPSNLDRYKEELTTLVATGDDMLSDLSLQVVKSNGKLTPNQEELRIKFEGTFDQKYQQWYTVAQAVISQIIPDRLLEFETLYRGDGKRKKFDIDTYNIQDWLMGRRAEVFTYMVKQFDDLGTVFGRFKTQLDILKSARMRFDSVLLDIKQLLQADLFDTELDAARELLKNGFTRPAGAISGVVLEGHLSQVCVNHRITVKKKDPSINDYNDLLKETSVIEIPLWRFIQRLGDLRNLCDHKKSKDPTNDDVDELISGVDRVIKTLS